LLHVVPPDPRHNLDAYFAVVNCVTGKVFLVRPGGLSSYSHRISVSGASRLSSSRVRMRESDLIAGAATTTSGNMVTQDTSQESIQFRKKLPEAMDGRLAIPAAIMDVNPDWMTPKTKWLWRRGMPNMSRSFGPIEANAMPYPFQVAARLSRDS
jgi:hypothetical protein